MNKAIARIIFGVANLSLMVIILGAGMNNNIVINIGIGMLLFFTQLVALSVFTKYRLIPTEDEILGRGYAGDQCPKK